MKRMIYAVAALALALSLPGCAKKSQQKQLNIFIWSEYLPDEVIAKFEERTGIDVQYDTYDSNEALEAKLQSGVADYDLVVPSDYMVRRLIQQGLIQLLDHARLPNMKNLDPRFLNKPFDPENKHSLPYFWGTTGLGYNKQKITEPVDSWGVLFEGKYEGRILMLDDMRECFAVAHKYAGRSLNESDPAAIAAAAALLKKQKELVQTYNSGDFANILAAGDVDLAHGYNGQIAEVVAAAPDKLAYVVPKEGGTFWMDNLCIPAKARNVDSAYLFLDFILEPEIGGEIVNGVSYASANAAAKAFIEPEILNDAAIYPPDDVIARCEFIDTVSDEALALYDKYWTEIKAQ
jgi:spermidine/putrescine-binding protein